MQNAARRSGRKSFFGGMISDNALKGKNNMKGEVGEVGGWVRG